MVGAGSFVGHLMDAVFFFFPPSYPIDPHSASDE